MGLIPGHMDALDVDPQDTENTPEGTEARLEFAEGLIKSFIGSMSAAQAAGVLMPLALAFKQEYIDVLRRMAKRIGGMRQDYDRNHFDKDMTELLGEVKLYSLLSNTCALNGERAEEFSRQRVTT